MVKTLRITGIVAAILAAVLVTFPAVIGAGSDEQIEQFLSAPGVIEKFNEAKGAKRTKSQSQVSPLVKQAQAFALYLNPPPKPEKPKTTVSRKPSSTTPRPPAVSAKFKLEGTSYYALHPELSLALIDQPGKGLRWVRQGSKVGHLVVEQVKDGLVVVRDNQRTFELVAERLEKRSLLKGASKEPPPGQTGPKPAITALGERADAGITSVEPPQMSPEEKASMEQILTELGAFGEAFESGEADFEQFTEESQALMDKLFSELGGAQVSDEEANKLNALGEELKKDVQPEPSRAKSRIVRRRVRSRRLKSSTKK